MKTNFLSKTIGTLIVMFLIGMSGFAQDSHKPNDAEIASVAIVANQIDIDYAKIAMKKSKNSEVQEFAKTMIADHSAIIKMATDLVTKLGVTPQDNKMSQSLMEEAKETTKKLNSAEGKEFDEFYINNEVAYHEAVINAVKGVLIPQSQNDELKKLLQTAIPILETHFEHAKMIQKDILK